LGPEGGAVAGSNNALIVFVQFFTANIRNRNTREAYALPAAVFRSALG
jgi:hypothetical protein